MSYDSHMTYFIVIQCNVTCGRGYQTRVVTCQHINGTIVDDVYCNAHSKPPEIKPCILPCKFHNIVCP